MRVSSNIVVSRRKVVHRWAGHDIGEGPVGRLTIVSLGEGLNRRYYQRSSFPSLMPQVETRRGAGGSQRRGQPPVFDLFFMPVKRGPDDAREATRAGGKRPGRIEITPNNARHYMAEIPPNSAMDRALVPFGVILALSGIST